MQDNLEMNELVDRLKTAINKDLRGELTHGEARGVVTDAEELARRLRLVRRRFPNVPAANLSPHLVKMLKSIAERYREAEIGSASEPMDSEIIEKAAVS
jgi:hypothetical protein